MVHSLQLGPVVIQEHRATLDEAEQVVKLSRDQVELAGPPDPVGPVSHERSELDEPVVLRVQPVQARRGSIEKALAQLDTPLQLLSMHGQAKPVRLKALSVTRVAKAVQEDFGGSGSQHERHQVH